MSDFRELTDRATTKLRRDRDLRLEVTRELETHLEASAAEFRAADYSEEDAQAAAVKAFGDPDTMANDLWDANRFRLKIRVWAWWVARLTLLPTCVIAALLFIVSGLTATTRLNEVTSGVGPHQEGLLAWQEQRLKSKMTAEQRLIYFGDESADDPIDRWRAVRDAHPAEVLDQLELISIMLSRLPEAPKLDPWPPNDPEGYGGPYFPPTDDDLAQHAAAQTLHGQAKEALLAELERGAAMDPDNGIYALLTAGLALHGFEFDDESPDATVAVSVLRSGGEPGEREDWHLNRWPVDIDRGVLDEALPWFEVAAGKPYISMHTSDRVRRRLAQLPAPRSMQEYMQRLSTEIQTLLPMLGHARRVSRAVGAEALWRAEAGDAAGALDILDQLDAVTASLASSSDVLISLLVARSIESLERAYRVAVWQALGQEAKAENALASSDALARYWRAEWRDRFDSAEDKTLSQRSGVVMGQIVTVIPGYDVDTTPFRKAEYTLVDRGVLTTGLIAMIVLSALASLLGVWSLWRKRGAHEGAVLLWIGWRRLAWVIGGAAGLPVLGFWVWSWTPWSGRGYGLNYSFAALVWYLPLVLTVGVLL